MNDDLPVILFETEQNLIDWLDQNSKSSGVWIRIAKKSSGVKSISYDQAVEVALSFGWIDGLKKTFDDKTWIQRFSQRKPTSQWSKINRDKALKLIDNGKMKPEGMAIIEIAKIRGTWDNAYDSQKTMTVPSDLQAELDKNPQAAEFFKTMESVNRYAIIYRLQVSRNPEIRAKKLAKFIEMLNRKEKIHN